MAECLARNSRRYNVAPFPAGADQTRVNLGASKMMKLGRIVKDADAGLRVSEYPASRYQ
jgi:hypothetical protein